MKVHADLCRATVRNRRLHTYSTCLWLLRSARSRAADGDGSHAATTPDGGVTQAWPCVEPATPTDWQVSLVTGGKKGFIRSGFYPLPRRPRTWS